MGSHTARVFCSELSEEGLEHLFAIAVSSLERISISNKSAYCDHKVRVAEHLKVSSEFPLRHIKGTSSNGSSGDSIDSPLFRWIFSVLRFLLWDRKFKEKFPNERWMPNEKTRFCFSSTFIHIDKS